MIIIGTPTRDNVSAGTTSDLIQLIKYRRGDADWCAGMGTYLPNLRTQIVKVVQELKGSHVMFIDSDMRFPPDTIDRLLARDKMIIGCNCPQRTQRQTTAFKNGAFIPSLGQTGIEEVDSVGMGIMLINMEVFTTIPEPWFAMPWVKGERHMGEDVFFCHNAKDHGFPVFIDHELSVQIRHIGEVEFTHEYTQGD